MTHWLLELQRRRWRRRAGNGPLDALFDSALPAKQTVFEDLEFVCLDMETTGLDTETADILSVGWVLIRRNRAELSTAAHYLVRPPGGVGDSATVHGITDSQAEAGIPITVVMEHIVAALPGRCLVVHHASLDKTLLDRESRRCFGAPLAVPVIDTLALEHRRRQRAHHLESDPSLRLPDLRQSYGLPRYIGHDALADAIATAELLLAMVARNGGARQTRLAVLLR